MMMQRKTEETPERRERSALLERLALRVKKALISGSEVTLAVVLVLLFFAIFSGILVASFPRGSGLSNLYGDLISPDRRDSSVMVGGRARTFVAELVDVTRLVKDRPADEVAWRSSSPGLALGNNHAVQTFADSGANISFEGQGELTLGPNSLVVLRQQQTAYHMLRDRAALVVLGGEVRGRLPRLTGDELGLEIVAAGATATLAPSGDDPASFSIKVNDDNSATLQMLTGAAEIRSGEESAHVGADEALTFWPSVSLGSALSLPRTPDLLSPTDGSKRSYGRGAPRVALRWGESGAEDYRIVVARNPALTDVVHEGRYDGTAFEIGNLTEGSYYWAVAGLKGEISSRPGEVRTFTLVQDLEPPALAVVLPEETVETDRLVVHGRTDPGSRVLVGRGEVPVGNSGEFELTVDLRPGPNLIVVEAVDEVGNVAYVSKYVNAKLRASRNRP